MHETFFVLHINQFFVNARLDVNDGRIIEASRLRHGINGFLDGLEVAAAVSGDHEIGLSGNNIDGEEQGSDRRKKNQLSFWPKIHGQVHGLGPTWSRIETSSLACRLDFHVLEEYRAARIYNFARFYSAENTVYKGYVINHCAGKTGNPHHARTRRALNIFESDVAHDRFVRPVRPRLVHKIDRQDRFLHAAHLDVAHENIFVKAAAPQI